MGVEAGGDISVDLRTIYQQTVYQQAIAAVGLGPSAEQRLARTAQELAGAVRAQEAAELARLVADTGDARPAEVGFAQPALLHWRTDGGQRSGTLSQIQGYYNRLDRGRLVVQGPAGSGKTVLAIQLVRDLAAAFSGAELIEGCRGDDGKRVRVPVRLSAPAFDPAAGHELTEVAAGEVASRLDAWVAEQLRLVYGVEAKQAVGLVAGGWVLPVLDGVDEMDPPDQPESPRAAALLAALNQPTAAGLRPVVLTCRTDRYTQLSQGRDAGPDPQLVQDATVVEVEPLTAAAARKYLIYRFPDPSGTDYGEPRWRPVLDRLDPSTDRPRDPLVASLRSPLRLFLAVAGYGGTATEPVELTRHLTATDLDDHLFGLLVPAAAARHPRPGGGRYSPEQVTRWLATLARHLREEDLAGRSGTDLLLHDLWSAAGDRLPRYVTAALLTIAATVPLVLFWMRDLVSVGLPRDAFIGAAVIGCVFVVALMAWASLRRLTNPQRLDLRKLRTRAGRSHLAIWLATGIMAGLAIGFGIGAAGGFAGGFVVGLVDGLVFGLVFGIALGLALGLAFGLAARPDAIDVPRQLVSGGVAHTTARLAVGLTVGFAWGFAAGPVKGLVFGLLFGLASASTSPWLRYLVACLLLARRQELPRRPALFLNWAYDAGLMRLAGIAVQFRHRDFQDWLTRHASLR